MQHHNIIFGSSLQAEFSLAVIFIPKKEDGIMKNPPGYGSVIDLGGRRRRPIAVRVPNGKKFNKQGKEIIDYKYLGYFERTKQGKTDAQNLLAQYNAGTAIKLPRAASSCPTFKEIADIWLTKHLRHIQAKKGEVSNQLNRSYNAAIQKCSSIHGKRIDAVKYQDVQDIADSVSSMSISSVTNLKTVLFGIFDLARKQKYISENFIKDVDFLYKSKEDKIHSSFTRDEVVLLWEKISIENIRIILILVYTGMRVEELLSIKTVDVHLDEKYMIGGVKTAAGKKRIIPIADKVYPFIEELYNGQNVYLLSHGGKRYTYNRFIECVWTPAMEYLNMEHLPHDTRYTCASMMDRAKVNDNSKKTILGHAKEGITNRIYVEKDLQDLLTAINMI
ncbi:MAG: tyrosine-type recombinase/integrase [Lachnospiraceae bacterium]|nr:tyrosine-type recombinase/integrase [Lachnospiraceae bacterium]